MLVGILILYKYVYLINYIILVEDNIGLMNFYPERRYPRQIQNNAIQQQSLIWEKVSKLIDLIKNDQSIQIYKTNVMLNREKKQTINSAIQTYERIKQSNGSISQKTQFLIQMLIKYRDGYEQLASTYQKTSIWRDSLQKFLCRLLEVLKLMGQNIASQEKNRLNKFLIGMLKYADLDAKQFQKDILIKQSLSELQQLRESYNDSIIHENPSFLVDSNPFQINIKNRLSSYFHELEILCQNETPFWELRISGNDIQCCACKPSVNSKIFYYIKPSFSKQMSPPETEDQQLNRFYNVLSWSIKLLSLKSDSYMLRYAENGQIKKITFEKIVEKILPVMQQISEFDEIGVVCLHVYNLLENILNMFQSSIEAERKNIEVVSGLIIRDVGQLKRYFQEGKVENILQKYDKSLNLLEKKKISQGFQKLLLENSDLRGAQNQISAISNTLYFILTAIRADLKDKNSIIKDLMDITFTSTQTRQSNKTIIAKKISKKYQIKNANYLLKLYWNFFLEKI